MKRSCHGVAPARLAVLSVGWSPPPPNESGTSAIACSSSSSRGGSSHPRRRLQVVDREVTTRCSHPTPEPVESYTRWLASDYHGIGGCLVERFCPRQHRPTPRSRSAGGCMERWRPAKTTRASGMPSQRQLVEVIGRGLVTVMASSSANVDGTPTTGGHVTEGALSPEVSGVLRSNARAAVGVTNASAAEVTNGAAAGDTTGVAAIEVTNGAAVGDTNASAARDTNASAAGDTSASAAEDTAAAATVEL